MLTSQELQKMSPQELDKELIESMAKLMKLHLALYSRESRSVAELNNLRKYVARIKTFKHQLQNH